MVGTPNIKIVFFLIVIFQTLSFKIKDDHHQNSNFLTGNFDPLIAPNSTI